MESRQDVAEMESVATTLITYIALEIRCEGATELPTAERRAAATLMPSLAAIAFSLRRFRHAT